LTQDAKQNQRFQIGEIKHYRCRMNYHLWDHPASLTGIPVCRYLWCQGKYHVLPENNVGFLKIPEGKHNEWGRPLLFCGQYRNAGTPKSHLSDGWLSISRTQAVAHVDTRSWNCKPEDRRDNPSPPRDSQCRLLSLVALENHKTHRRGDNVSDGAALCWFSIEETNSAP